MPVEICCIIFSSFANLESTAWNKRKLLRTEEYVDTNRHLSTKMFDLVAQGVIISERNGRAQLPAESRVPAFDTLNSVLQESML